MNRIYIFMVVLMACQQGKEGEKPSSYSTGVVTNNGIATAEVEIDSDATTFLVTAKAWKSNVMIAVETIRRPNGSVTLDWMDWYYENTYLMAGIWPRAQDVVVNWPVRAEDPPLTGGSWEITFAAVNANFQYLDNIEIDLLIQTKADDDFETGAMNVVIAYAEGVSSIPGVEEGIERGVERWREVWLPHGLFLNERYIEVNIDKDMAFVGNGDETFDHLSQQIDDDEVLMIIGESIGGEQLYYGVAGNIPGSLIDSPRSAVQISWLANSGLDGDFSDDDIRLMGETMAHEMGHYMGLFHPVEIEFNAWDAASDTPQCASANTCEAQLGDNLMYPYPVCLSSTACIAQEEITTIQAGIAHRYTGTL